LGKATESAGEREKALDDRDSKQMAKPLSRRTTMEEHVNSGAGADHE
jgi:hypothetical protein